MKKNVKKPINLWEKCHFWTSEKIQVWLKSEEEKRERKLLDHYRNKQYIVGLNNQLLHDKIILYECCRPPLHPSPLHRTPTYTYPPTPFWTHLFCLTSQFLLPTNPTRSTPLGWSPTKALESAVWSRSCIQAVIFTLGELICSVSNTRIFIDLYLPRLTHLMMPDAFLMCAASAFERVLAEPFWKALRSPERILADFCPTQETPWSVPFLRIQIMFLGRPCQFWDLESQSCFGMDPYHIISWVTRKLETK